MVLSKQCPSCSKKYHDHVEKCSWCDWPLIDIPIPKYKNVPVKAHTTTKEVIKIDNPSKRKIKCKQCGDIIELDKDTPTLCKDSISNPKCYLCEEVKPNVAKCKVCGNYACKTCRVNKICNNCYRNYYCHTCNKVDLNAKKCNYCLKPICSKCSSGNSSLICSDCLTPKVMWDKP